MGENQKQGRDNVPLDREKGEVQDSRGNSRGAQPTGRKQAKDTVGTASRYHAVLRVRL